MDQNDRKTYGEIAVNLEAPKMSNTFFNVCLINYLTFIQYILVLSFLSIFFFLSCLKAKKSDRFLHYVSRLFHFGPPNHVMFFSCICIGGAGCFFCRKKRIVRFKLSVKRRMCNAERQPVFIVSL